MTSADQPGAPSQEELRAYVEQLRRAEPSEIVLQAYTMLGTGAEAKIGRPDARVLIDALTGMVQAVGDRLGPQMTAGMRNGLNQLHLMQVEAEREAAAPPPPADQPGAQTQSQAQPPPEQPSQPRQRPQQGGSGPDQRMTDRLWIPGRDPKPAR